MPQFLHSTSVSRSSVISKQCRSLYISVGVLLMAVVASTRVWADCDAVLTQAGQNVQTQQGAVAVIANKYANACFTDWSKTDDNTTANADVEVFGEGSGSGSLSTQAKRERLTNWCSLNKQNYESNQTLYQQSRVGYDKAIDAWRECKAIEGQSLQLNPVIHDDQLSAEFLVRTTDGSTSTFTGISSHNFDCKVTIRNSLGALHDVDPAHGFAITSVGTPIKCNRAAPTAVNIGGVTFSKYPAGSITVSTAGRNFAVEFIEKQDPPLSEAQRKTLESKIATLGSSLTSLQTALSDTNQKLSEDVQHREAIRATVAQLVEATKFVIYKSNVCPPGWTKVDPLMVAGPPDDVRNNVFVQYGIATGAGPTPIAAGWLVIHPELCIGTISPPP